MLHSHRILEDISPLGQVIDEKVRRCVPGAFIIGQPVLKAVLAQHAYRLGTASSMVLHVDILHVAISSQRNSANDFFTDRHRTGDRFKYRPTFG